MSLKKKFVLSAVAGALCGGWGGCAGAAGDR